MSVSPIVKQLKHPKEKAYGTIVLIVGIIIWLVVLGILSSIPFAGPSFMLAILVGILLPLVGAAIYRAIAFGNMTLLGPNQFPELYRMVGRHQGAQSGEDADHVPVQFQWYRPSLCTPSAGRQICVPHFGCAAETGMKGGQRESCRKAA